MPQYNGIIEIIHRMLMEKERIMLNGSILGQKLLVEVLNNSCYLVNQSPSSTLVEKLHMRHELIEKTPLKHLIVFGCDAQVHVPKTNRSKHDNKHEKCIFIGYKLWNSLTKKTIYSWDVALREVKVVPKHDFPLREKEIQIIEFDMEDEKYNSIEEEEPHTSILRRTIQKIRQLERYSPP